MAMVMVASRLVSGGWRWMAARWARTGPAYRDRSRAVTIYRKQPSVNPASYGAPRRAYGGRTRANAPGSSGRPAASLGPMDKGDKAPDFELPDEDGVPRRLSELAASGPVVLFFYPAAMTPDAPWRAVTSGT